ncbi:WD40 repeat domain-containing serine/threonine protein kinase [Nonomuraea sp. SBT364]|uniref:WD40 repeat domain-containing serine/threonine protein kinase n=1 Tax=Nonomuraea sp. SBT364 TaxID=1580530 RepID=UPI00069E3A56|nr:WD40 repeat domain-containing serine/threonine protein kinase [Nonomuraea sp. SBT364]
MADFGPLIPGDPEQMGGLELLGRLGHGGQGVVYLARTPMDVRVAVKWLNPPDDEESVERFVREAEVARRVAPFCTAAVLSTGVEQGRPYIVSEYVEGRSLDRVVGEDGPLTGGDLERLAIGTATALAAIHEAGVVHRDFKPGNVIMGVGGPRVIDFGIARTLGPATMTSSTQIGTPAYMAPEQIMGHGLSPAADMFSWAGTMIFASCGRAPFGADWTPAVLHRVLNDRPDLGLLDERLADLVRQCLDKEPKNRPVAMEAIARLVRNPEPGTKQGTDPGTEQGTGALAEGAGQATPGSVARTGRARPSRTSLLVLAGAVITVAAVAAATVVPGWLRSPTPTGVSPATVPARQATARATPVEVPLPGGAITLYESPSDPITLTAYEVHDDKLDEDVDYARQSLRGAFDVYPDNVDSLVSPDGRYLAGRPEDYTSDGYDSILITDRQKGASFRVRTVREPQDASIRAWSKDSSKILLNVNRKIENEQGKDVWTTLGFAVLDVAGGRVRVTEVADDSIRNGDFGWDGDERGVIAVSGKDEALRFFDISGNRTRDLPGVGPPASGTVDLFSPSGRMFSTDCPGGDDGDHCVWDTATGKRSHTFSSDCDKVLGWYDESHLYCWEYDNGANDEVRVVAFDGKLVRRLLEADDKLEVAPYFTINPDRS